MYAGRDELAATKARRYTTVDTPIGTYRIRSLTDKERNTIEKWQLTQDGQLDEEHQLLIKAMWLAMTLVDDEGCLLYTPSDVETIADADSAIVNKIVDKVFQHVGVSNKDIEELEKNWLQTVDAGFAPTV